MSRVIEKMMLARSHLFWSAVAGLAVANIAAFILPMNGLNVETQMWQIRAYSSLLGIGALLFCMVAQGHWGIRLGWFLGIAAVSFMLFAFGLWLMVAGDSHDVPLAGEHFINALPNLIRFAPAWASSQAALALMLLSYGLASRRLGLR